jgi:Leucine-rich repeat (LRR) protein
MKHRILALDIFLAAIIIVTAGWTFGRISLKDRSALSALYNKTNGRYWLHQKNWNQAPGSENTWQGISCDADNTTVLKIELPNNRLQGVLPADMKVFANLTTLDLSNNRLSGEIPHWLESLKNLKKLDISNNDFSGSIPAWIGSLKNLEELVLDNNRLEGTIPKELAYLLNLKVLRLAGNRLIGDIPAELVRLVNLDNNRCDFRWNGLYTRETGIKEFLRRKQLGGDWESTQTTAPFGIVAESTEDTITVRWQPILYTTGSGGYRFFYREEGEPYDDKACEYVSGKRAVEVSLKKLKKSTKYHFKICTWTGNHTNNKNRIDSPFIDEMSMSTRGIIISGTIRNWDGEGVPGVMITTSNDGGIAETDKDGIYQLNVMPGWTGIVIPFRQGFAFSPPSRNYDREITENISGNDYIIEPDTVISGTVTYKGKGISSIPIKFIGKKGDNYSALTDENGIYKKEVSYDWSGSVTPIRDMHRFDPKDRKYDNVKSSLYEQNYGIQFPKIFGEVKNLKGKGVSGVKLKFSNMAADKFKYLKDYAITDKEGNYENDVLENWIGIVKPESYPKSKYFFYPKSKEIEQFEKTISHDFKAWRNFKFFLQLTFNSMNTYIGIHDISFIYPEITVGFKFSEKFYIWSGVDFIYQRSDSSVLEEPSLLLQQSFSLGIGYQIGFPQDLSKSRSPHFKGNIELGITQLNYQDNKIQSMDWGGNLGIGFIYNYNDRWFVSLKIGVLFLGNFELLKKGVSLGYRF